jgi:uncharacterized protein (TIGR00369 family)
MTDAADPGPQAARNRATAQFIGALPHCGALDLSVERVADGVAEISMPWSADLVGDPATQVVHGGAVSALMDTTGGAAVMSHPEAAVSTATMGLRIEYLRAARPRQTITARAVCHHVTRSVAFVRAEARDEEGVVAQAHGTFTLDRR